MSASCPRCQKPLETAQVDTIQVRLCQDCRGVLLAHPDLVQMIEASWRAVSEKQAEETQFRAPEGWQQEGVLRCPDCGQAMEKYGYMGIGAIQIDRCDPCNLVWLDTDELQNMVLALAKTNHRSELSYQNSRRQRMDISVGVMPPAEIAEPWLFPESGTYTGAAVLVQTLLQLVLK
jgi:Zn-finger nucleic acid-binding protein